MAMYGIGIRPLIDKLASECGTGQLTQAWYADDSSAGGKLQKLKNWLDIINADGPKYGYNWKPSKTVIILKDPEKLQECQELFDGYGITITTEGSRHVGAAIGTDDFKRLLLENW